MTDISDAGNVSTAPEVVPDFVAEQVAAPVTTPEGTEPSGINPAWAPVLEVLPTQLHHLVTPQLQQWDKNFQTEVGKAQQQFEPWKELAESGIDPVMAHGILNLMNTNPQQLVDTMIQYYNLSQGQTPAAPGTPPNPLDQLDLDQIQAPDNGQFDIESHPAFQALKLQNEQIMQGFNQRAQQEVIEKANAEIDNEIKAVQTAHPDVNVQDLIMFAANTPGIENMQQAYDNMVAYNQRVLQNRPTNGAPPVLAPTGGTPSPQATPVASMGRKDRVGLVAEILAQAAQAQG